MDAKKAREIVGFRPVRTTKTSGKWGLNNIPNRRSGLKFADASCRDGTGDQGGEILEGRQLDAGEQSIRPYLTFAQQDQLRSPARANLKENDITQTKSMAIRGSP